MKKTNGHCEDNDNKKQKRTFRKGFHMSLPIFSSSSRWSKDDSEFQLKKSATTDSVDKKSYLINSHHHHQHSYPHYHFNNNNINNENIYQKTKYNNNVYKQNNKKIKQQQQNNNNNNNLQFSQTTKTIKPKNGYATIHRIKQTFKPPSAAVTKKQQEEELLLCRAFGEAPPGFDVHEYLIMETKEEEKEKEKERKNEELSVHFLT